MTRASAPGLVARALARSWWNRPVRLLAAVTGGIGGVLITVAVLMISVPVLQSLRVAPVESIATDVVAVTATAPAGIAPALVDRVIAETGATASRMVLSNTNVRVPDGDFAPMTVLGVDIGLPSMLESSDQPVGPALLLPGQVYLARSWADDHGVVTGDQLEIGTPTGAVQWRVAGLLVGDFANNGSAVIAPIGSVATAFARGSAVDIVLLKPRDAGGDIAAAAGIVAGAATVGPADSVFDSYSRFSRTPLILVWMFLGIGLLTGAVVLFLTWRLALADVAPILARMRLLGVRDTDFMLGSGLVMIPVLLLSYGIGAVLGVVIGRSLDSITVQITNFTQQARDPGVNLLLPLAGGFVGAVLMFGFAWAAGVWAMRRVSAIDAVTGRDTPVVQASRVGLPLAAGVACVVIAAGVLFVASRISDGLVAGIVDALAGPPVIVGAVILSVVLPVAAGIVIRRASTGSTGLFVGRQLQVHWRRNAALGIVFAVALITSVAMAGASASIRGELDASMARWTNADVYIQAAPVGKNLAGETLPVTLAEEIRRLPGVEGVYSFAVASAVINGSRFPVWWMAGDTERGTATKVLDGPADVLQRVRGDEIAVASNFALTQRVGVGDTVDIPVPDGHRVGRIIAVLDDSASDGGAVIVGEDLFEQVVGRSSVYTFGASVADGAEKSVAESLETLLAQKYPRAVVLDRDGYRSSISSMLGNLMSSFQVFAWVMFGVAALVGTTTLASNITERRRGIALTQLAGGRSDWAGRLLLVEALVIVVVAWVAAVPAGLLAAMVMLGGQSVQSGIAPPLAVPASMVAGSLPAALIAVMIAMWIARRSVAGRPIAQLIAEE